jgi:hypothetical protein
MQPIGLTFKKIFRKYAANAVGELMLVHQCCDCGSVSINRIAADDDPATIIRIFQSSLELESSNRAKLAFHGIQILQCEKEALVQACLFGKQGC